MNNNVLEMEKELFLIELLSRGKDIPLTLSELYNELFVLCRDWRSVRFAVETINPKALLSAVNAQIMDGSADNSHTFVNLLKAEGVWQLILLGKLSDLDLNAGPVDFNMPCELQLEIKNLFAVKRIRFNSTSAWEEKVVDEALFANMADTYILHSLRGDYISARQLIATKLYFA